MAKRKKMKIDPWMMSTVALLVLVLGFVGGNFFSSFTGDGTPDVDFVLGERSGGVNGSEGYGEADAPVVIKEFSDFQCPYCQRFFANTLPSIEEAYIKTGKVRIEYKDFPLGSHQNAKPAAIAARCAGAQGNYWGMHDVLFLNHEAWASSLDPKSVFKAMAKALKLNEKKFAVCLESTEFNALIDADQAEGARAGMTGTPGFLINGEKIVGAMPFATFQAIIDPMLNPQAEEDTVQ
ncbi:MAG: thioredoxin domain-containing protein [Candidatus Peregrinibacteria bacterium]|nr:thioredoxin domain-containing protein [Candidatus Peregrinibacteria bacterium]MDZ4244785.1 thioredoxin domain-containing protein [Candidatus Gracilibacteria bacterium]